MIASAITLRRLMNRLPEPRRATLADLGHAAAMLARGRLTPDHDAQVTERLDRLQRWLTAADRSLASPPNRRKAA